jgi:hypothetical protein
MDLTLTARPRPGTAGTALDEVHFELVNRRRAKLNDDPALNAVLKAFTVLTQQGHDPFVSLRFADDLKLSAIHEVCRLVASIETETGIRVEPPRAGELFYMAFVPNETFRQRAKRLSQPPELHLAVKEGKVSGTLVHIDQTWTGGSLKPQLSTRECPVTGPLSLRTELDKEIKRIAGKKELPHDAILVFAPPSLGHKPLMDFVKPALSTHPMMHVFLKKAEKPKTP